MPVKFSTRARCAAAIAFSLMGALPVLAVDATRLSATRGLILSNLPPAGSAEYDVLRNAAGDAQRQSLEMTASEMWNIAPERVDALRAAASAKGVEVLELDEKSNMAMAPMDAAAPMTESQRSMMRDAMASKATMRVSMMALPDPKVLEYALTKGMDAPGSGEPAELILPLDAKTTVAVRRASVEKTPDGYIWHGTIEETGDPVTLLWWPIGRMAGQITYRGHHYVVKHMGGAMHGVVEMSTRKLPPEHAPMGKTLQKEMQMRQDPLVTKGDASMLRELDPAQKGKTDEPIRNLQDAGSKSGAAPKPHTGEDVALLVPPIAPSLPRRAPVTIDLIVAYTPQAASHYTDIRRDLIDVAIAEANQSFRNSGIDNVHLRLVHAYETSYSESGTHFEHVFRFADKGDGYMEEVHGLRDEYKADIAALVVHDPNGCGLSAAVAPPADRAFTVVHHECAALSYSLAHEIGHLIGARHDLALDDGKQPFAYGHGFVSGKDWRTMMSYEESCDGCPRLPVWSNPRLKLRGVVAGDAMADNARALSEGAARVAAFR